jgi:bleomycin hydrolase
MGKGEYDLSEMFVVHHAYDSKADKYIRMQGSLEFAEGGEPNDVMDVIRTYGIVPQAAYTGFKPKEDKVDHSEMSKVLKGYLDALIKPKTQTLSNVWFKGYEKVLDTYLGDFPAKFKYEGQEYTPLTFEEKLGFNPDDYVLLTSYTHHPFYTKFALEIPDNWSWEKYYNVPIDELIAIMDNAINSNYSILWAADVSEKGFSFNQGTATIPDINEKITSSDEWKKLRARPTLEKTITQEMRQEQFDNFSTTDDHGMHMTGIAKDQNGKKFYYIKNSWGTDNPYAGYFYASEAYVKLKTMSIMVNKNAIPKEIRSKLRDL